jgi:ribosomal protein L7/L12
MAEARELLEIKQRLTLLEVRMQQLFEHLDLEPREIDSGDAAADPEIQDLLAKGNELQAIKRYRELTGAGLGEAKEAIERAKPGG